MITAIARRGYTFICPYCKKNHHVGLDFFRFVEGNRDFTCKDCGNQFMLDPTEPCRCRQYD